MKFFVLLVYLFLILTVFPLYSDAQQDADSEPADPDIVLPSVVLEIEDLSIETIEAILPEDTELLPPEREVPLPEDEVMEVADPGPKVALPDSDTTVRSADESFVAEAVLGAGSINNILSRISFYKLGDIPRYKLLFSHEMLDGFAFQEAGTGFNLREDSLEASVKGNLGPVESEISGNFREIEHGLQDQTDTYFSHITRFISGTALLSIMPVDIFKLYTNIEGSLASMSLTGSAAPDFNAAYPPTEVLAGASLGGELQFETLQCGITASYKYRNIFGSDNYELHRIYADLYWAAEFPYSLNIDGSVGYFYNTDIPWLIPFYLELSANPVESFSFRIEGGYRIEENNLYSLWEDNLYSGFPESPGGESVLPDNHGWYGDGGMKFNFDNTYILTLGLGLSKNTRVFPAFTTGTAAESIPDSITGLFPLSPLVDIVEGTGEAGMRINIARWFYINLNTKGYVLFGDELLGWMEALFEGVSTEEKGNFGGSFSLLFKTNFIEQIELPEFDIALFYKISDNIRIIGEGYDLLSPFMANGRILRGPYISPGIRGTFMVQITF